MQSIHRVPGGDTVLAVFTTPPNAPAASAVCALSLRRAAEVFSRSPFRAQLGGADANWLPVPQAKTPKPRYDSLYFIGFFCASTYIPRKFFYRPGQCISSSSSSSRGGRSGGGGFFPDDDDSVNFIRRNVLMDEALEAMSTSASDPASPIYVQISHGERLTAVAAAKGEGVDKGMDVIAGTSDGRWEKILMLSILLNFSFFPFSRVSRLLHLRTDSSNRRAALLSSSRLFPRGTPVRAVAASASASGERWAAAVADGEVVSAPAERCDRHEDCSECVEKDGDEACVWAAEEGRCRADGPGLMGWRAVVREGEECPVVVEEEEEETTVATEN